MASEAPASPSIPFPRLDAADFSDFSPEPRERLATSASILDEPAPAPLSPLRSSARHTSAHQRRVRNTPRPQPHGNRSSPDHPPSLTHSRQPLRPPSSNYEDYDYELDDDDDDDDDGNGNGNGNDNEAGAGQEWVPGYWRERERERRRSSRSEDPGRQADTSGTGTGLARTRPLRAPFARPNKAADVYSVVDRREFGEQRGVYEPPRAYPDAYPGKQPSREPRFADEEKAIGGGMGASGSHDGAPEEKAARERRNSSSIIGMAGRHLEWDELAPSEKAEATRLPWTRWMGSSVKDNMVATLGEFVGTTFFLLFAFGATEVASMSSRADTGADATTGLFPIATLLYMSLAFGFSLMVNVWIFFRISGGLFNPAVTMAMALVRAISISRAVCLFIAQMAASALASVMVRYLVPDALGVRTTLSARTTVVQGVFLEAVLTAELVFAVLMLAREKHGATFVAPVGIGLALFIGEMVGVQYTGGSLNPARSFGPCVVTWTWDPEHWVYWVGPLGGSVFAVIFYKFIKTLEYELANPGADGDPENDPTKNPGTMAETVRASTHSSARGLI